MKSDGKIAIFFENTFRIFEDFDPAERLQLYDAYFRYVFDDIEPVDLPRDVRRVWMALLPVIDHRKAKQRAGRAGGTASGESKRQAKSKQNDSKSVAEEKQTESKPVANGVANSKLSTKYKVQSTKDNVQTGNDNSVSVSTVVSEEFKVNGDTSSLSMSTGKARSTKTKTKTIADLKNLYPEAMDLWQAVREVYPANRRHAPSEGLLQLIESKKLWERKDEIVSTTRRFATTDDEWRRGYAPAMRRFFEEERYENAPTPPKPPEVREILTVRSSKPSITPPTEDTDIPQF